MQNYSYSGQSIPFLATEAVVSGQPYLLGSAFGVVSNTLIPGQSGELFVTGVWRLKKDASDVKIGAKLYWDTTNKDKYLTVWEKVDANGAAVPTPPTLKLVGLAAEATAGDTILCRLNGVSV